MINARYPLDSRELIINRTGKKVISEQYKLMYMVLRYALENLMDFYELERSYQELIRCKNSKEQINDFIEFLKSEFKEPINLTKIHMLEEIDKYNKRILN